MEGNGLYDASEPPGKYTLGVVEGQEFDVVTVGNHELYIVATAAREFEVVVPRFGEAYLASNVDFFDPKTGSWVPLARRYRKFQTANQNLTILAFGFLFDFKGNANNTRVQPVADTVKEDWFQDAIRDSEVDLFVIAGHVPVRDSPEFDAVFKAIREVRWDTPMVFFGGHTHVRDWRRWDSRAWGVESGRYMETIGFVSIDGITPKSAAQYEITHAAPGLNKQDTDANLKPENLLRKSPTYSRLYIDSNLYSLHHHSNTNSTTFPTTPGTKISEAITSARASMNLDHTFGCAPHSYYLTRAPYPSDSSLLTLLDTHILPDIFTNANSTQNPAIVMTNSGALRFDVFAGRVTEDTTYLLSPFLSGFRQIKNVPFGVADKVLELLNSGGQVLGMLAEMGEREGLGVGVDDLRGPKAPASPHSSNIPQSSDLVIADGSAQTPFISHDSKDKEPTLPGYTTHDDSGSDGDDTIHKALVFYNVPNCIASEIGFVSSDALIAKPETVDLVYNEFIQNWVLLALRFLGMKYGVGDTEVAAQGRTLTGVIREWVVENWECEDEKGNTVR